MGKKKSKKATKDDDSTEEYPITPRMDKAPPPVYRGGKDDDEDESEEGWSDDSGRDSDKFENEHVGSRGKPFKSSLPIVPDDDVSQYPPSPAQRSSSKSPPPPSRSDDSSRGIMGGFFSSSRNNNTNDDDYSDEDEDEPVASTLGGAYLSNSGRNLTKNRSRGSFSDEDRPPNVEPAQVVNENKASSGRSSSSDPPYKARKEHDDPPESPPLRQQPKDSFRDEPDEDYRDDRRRGRGAGAGVAYGGDMDNDEDDDSFDPSTDSKPNVVKPRSIRDDETGDLETSETGDHRSRGFDSVAFSESEKRHRKTVTWLLLGLACALVLLAALAGALIGVFVFGGNKSSGTSPSQQVPSTEKERPEITPAPSVAPTANEPCVPDAFSGITCNENATVASTIPGTTMAPTVPGTGGDLNATQEPTVPGTGGDLNATQAPTGTVAPTVPGSSDLNSTLAPTVPGSGNANATVITNQALFDAIAAVSPDGGATILQAGTPQSQAFSSVQSENLMLDEPRLIQRYAMRAFFYSTNGPTDWVTKTGWEETLDECLWYSQPSNGSTMCSGDVLQSLEFVANGVTGELPPELSMLTGMTTFSVKGVEGASGLSGGIPTTLTSLTGMDKFVLEHHKLKEPLPSGLFDAWSAATVINVADCNVPGMFPDLTPLKAVTNLNLSGNRLRGVFPAAATGLTTLIQFNIGGNKLNGPLPTTGFDGLTSLRFLSLADNSLTGPIPTQIGSLVSLRQGLDLSQNQLSNKIPTELNNLVNLQRLRLSYNILTGSVPDFSGLTKLREFAIEGNELTGTVSTETCAALGTAQSSADCNPEGGGEVICDCCATCCISTTDNICQQA